MQQKKLHWKKYNTFMEKNHSKHVAREINLWKERNFIRFLTSRLQIK